MSAFGAAISGLQSSEQWLSVISNNVANSETVGYKASEVNFADLISQTLSSPSGDDASDGIGGIDATQVGLGVTVGSIATDLSQGSIETTGQVTDIAIQGQGYLTVKTGDTTSYTRAGNLTFDSNGDLVTAEGGLVQGWSLTETETPNAPGPMTVISQTLDTSDIASIGNIVIPNNLQIAAQATSSNLNSADQQDGVSLAGNLDDATPENTGVAATGLTPATAAATIGAGAAATAADITTLQTLTEDANATSTFTTYDSLGNEHTFTAYWVQTANTVTGAPAVWSYYVFNTTGGATPSATAVAGTAGSFVLAGGGAGNTGSAAGDIVTDMTGEVTFNPNGSLATNGNITAGAASPNNPTISMTLANGAVTPFVFSLDLGTPNTAAAVGPPVVAASYGLSNGLTGFYGNGSTDPTTGVYTPVQTIYTKSTSGYAAGTLTGLSFNSTGGIAATFTNGQTIVVAQLALTNFTNPGGLESSGGNYFSATDNSGSEQIGTAGTDGLGTIEGSALEESNVSLSTELTNMILAQNLYQANAKVITTQGNLYTDLFNAIPQQ